MLACRYRNICMDTLTAINDFVNSIVWGPPMIVALVGTGILLTFTTRAFNSAASPSLFAKFWAG